MIEKNIKIRSLKKQNDTLQIVTKISLFLNTFSNLRN